jgi:hypothetical protein
MDNILRFLASPLCDAASVIRIIPRTIAASDWWLRIITEYLHNTEIKLTDKAPCGKHTQVETLVLWRSWTEVGIHK